MGKRKRNGNFLVSPDASLQVHRHNVDGEVRFTTPTNQGFDKLVGISRGDKFVWLHAAFRDENKLS